MILSTSDTIQGFQKMEKYINSACTEKDIILSVTQATRKFFLSACTVQRLFAGYLMYKRL